MIRPIHRQCFAGILASLLLLLANPGQAQEESVKLNQFRMLLYSGQHIEGSHGLLTANEFTGTGKNGDEIHLDRSEIKILDVAGASKTSQYAGIGALTGLLTAGMAVLQVQADPYSEVDTAKLVPVTGVLVGAGALVGAAIGSGAREWKNLPLTPSVGLAPDRSGLVYAMSFSF